MGVEKGILGRIAGRLNFTEPTVGGAHRQILESTDEFRERRHITVLGAFYDLDVVLVRHADGQPLSFISRRPDLVPVGYPNGIISSTKHDGPVAIQKNPPFSLVTDGLGEDEPLDIAANRDQLSRSLNRAVAESSHSEQRS